MSDEQPKNPLHGITLRAVLEDLVERRGFDDLASHISIRCFTHNPSIKSSLKFLRKTPWARAKVEALYLADKRGADKHGRSRGKPSPSGRRQPKREKAQHGDDGARGGNSDYLDRLMRRESFEAIWPLFANAAKPAKELTESFSALQHLRPFFPKEGPFRVIHIGDGAHARTAALFALKSRGENISVDPSLNLELVESWRDRFSVQRLALRKARVEDVMQQLEALPVMPLFITFVHAHVDVDPVLDALPFTAAFSLVCFVPGHQLSRIRTPHKTGKDFSVLSDDRHYAVWLDKHE